MRFSGLFHKLLKAADISRFLFQCHLTIKNFTNEAALTLTYASLAASTPTIIKKFLHGSELRPYCSATSLPNSVWNSEVQNFASSTGLACNPWRSLKKPCKSHKIQPSVSTFSNHNSTLPLSNYVLIRFPFRRWIHGVTLLRHILPLSLYALIWLPCSLLQLVNATVIRIKFHF